jgi:pimeloyl-ACP methyl ester carboxylesterase
MRNGSPGRSAVLALVPALLALLSTSCSDDSATDAGADDATDADVVQPDEGPDDAVSDPGEDAAEDDVADDAVTDDGGGPGVEWTPCELYPDDSSPRMAECATVDLPLRADEPDGPTIGVWVQRLRSTSAHRKGQIWLLEGGPGGSGADFAATIDQFSGVDPRWDFYTLDHRGVGLSARLGCPVQEDLASEAGLEITPAEAAACIAYLQDTWGDELAAFTSTNAARDLGALIDLLREPDRDVFVFGISYGSYWAIRYLQLFPEQATGVILDSIAPPGISFADFDVFYDDVGEQFVRLCGADPICSGKLGADPWAVVARVFDEVDAGACPAFSALFEPGTARRMLRHVLGALLQVWDLRPFVPAVVYRLDRCDEADVAALGRLTSFLLDGRPTAYDLRASPVVGRHVGLSELWPDPPPDPAELAATLETLYLSMDVGTEFAEAQDAWPTYPRDEYVGAWPSTSIPILMLNGNLDPQTPIWVTRPAADHFDGPNQRFYEFPRTPHGVVSQSHADTLTGLTCGADIMFQFLDNPLAEPDASCIDGILPIDFAGNPDYSTFLFGTPDLWENGGKADATGGVPVEPPGLERARRALRRASALQPATTSDQRRSGEFDLRLGGVRAEPGREEARGVPAVSADTRSCQR